VSHVEAGLSIPGERTVALLAGLFAMEPHELVAGTDYPAAKAERLPVVVPRWTEVEHRLELLGRDLDWIDGAGHTDAAVVLGEWDLRLAALASEAHDPEERNRLSAARRTVALRLGAHPSSRPRG
jgi:hypothetical protein